MVVPEPRSKPHRGDRKRREGDIHPAHLRTPLRVVPGLISGVLRPQRRPRRCHRPAMARHPAGPCVPAVRAKRPDCARTLPWPPASTPGSCLAFRSPTPWREDTRPAGPAQARAHTACSDRGCRQRSGIAAQPALRRKASRRCEAGDRWLRTACASAIERPTAPNAVGFATRAVPWPNLSRCMPVLNAGCDSGPAHVCRGRPTCWGRPTCRPPENRLLPNCALGRRTPQSVSRVPSAARTCSTLRRRMEFKAGTRDLRPP